MDVELNRGDCAWIVNKTLDLVFTTDGGATWQQTSRDVVGGFEHVRFLDAHWGWARSSARPGAAAKDLLWFTTDSGRSWSRLGDIVEFIRLYNGGSERGDNGPWLSSDGGSTWCEGEPPESWGDDAREVKLLDDGHGWWLAQSETILQSEDYGAHWFTHKFAQWHRFFALDSKTAWAIDFDNSLYQTTDGGRSWRKKKMRPPAGDSFELYFINERQGWLSTVRGLYRTDSGGSNWYIQETPGNNTTVESIYFRDQVEGWAAGEEEVTDSEQGADEKQYSGILLHSLDGGATWQRVSIEGNDDLYDRVRFGNDGQGWLVGQDTVSHSGDGGLTWQTVLRLADTNWKEASDRSVSW